MDSLWSRYDRSTLLLERLQGVLKSIKHQKQNKNTKNPKNKTKNFSM
jgi:hypothetical protein